MSMNIKSKEAHRLARELAQLRGVSLTHAVTEALQEKLEREKRQRRHEPLSSELLAIGKRCAAPVKEPLRSSDHGDLLYDGNGLPR
jgi:antitoxin VapB